MYMEASPPVGAPNRKAYLLSPTIDWNFPSSCVTFWYSMYGNTMGTLTLKTAAPNLRSSATVWHLSGDQGKGWHQANVTIHTAQAVRVRATLLTILRSLRNGLIQISAWRRNRNQTST